MAQLEGAAASVRFANQEVVLADSERVGQGTLDQGPDQALSFALRFGVAVAALHTHMSDERIASSTTSFPYGSQWHNTIFA